MIVYPAIDIRGGRCVRLIEGDFDRETIFDAEPADAARRWAGAGAEWIHIVDLDGAKAGRPVNIAFIRSIRDSVSCRLQLGGGLRTAGDVEAALAAGVDRVVLGSAAVSDLGLVRDLVTHPGDRIAVGLDARDGLLATDGWLEQTDVSALDRVRELVDLGVRTIVFTDIRRDGTLAGPNLDALRAIPAVAGLDVIASGGVGRLEDIAAVAESGAAGVIVGRALYDGRVDLAEALALARDPS